MAKKKEEVEATVKPAKVESVTVGDTVHFVQVNGFHSAALAVGVNEDGTLGLFVTRDDDVKDHYFVASASFSGDIVPGTWHRIEKE